MATDPETLSAFLQVAYKAAKEGADRSGAQESQPAGTGS